MLSVGLLGCGSIGQSILSTIARNTIEGIQFTVLCCREAQAQAARDLVPSAKIIHKWSDYNGPAPQIVVEAAGQGAVNEFGESILAAGSDLYLLSVGALADKQIHDRLVRAADKGNSRVIIPSGALAGFDGLHSLRASGLESVLYRSTKPPRAWKGTLAETLIDLDNVRSPVTFFRGNAAEAALKFPKNANLAAAVGLAGLGLEKTQVELVADSSAPGNTGSVTAVGAGGVLKLELAGRSHAGNPKSSQITGMSVVAALESRASRISFAS